MQGRCFWQRERLFVFVSAGDAWFDVSINSKDLSIELKIGYELFTPNMMHC